jgi:hypothetical protein
MPYLYSWYDLFLPYFLNKFINDLLELPHLPPFNQFGQDLIFPVAFQFTYCHLYVYIIWRLNKRLCSLYALSTLLHCHCVFHLAVQSASHNIQTTFVGLSLCCLL